MMRLRHWLLAAAAGFLGLWGIGWCLPEAGRAARVLPPGSDSARFRQALKTSWQQLHQRLGEDIVLHPEAFSPGFHKIAIVPPGWATPPEQLLNSSRSFYLRSGQEDESDILFALSKIKPWRMEFNPRIYYYGGAYLYPLGAWLALASVVTPMRLSPDVGFYLEHPAQTAWLYLAGRLFSAAVYGLNLWLLFILGRKLFGPGAGFAAAALYAAAPGVVIQAHYMKPHLLGHAFVLLALFCCVELIDRGGALLWAFAGAAVGLAGGCAVNLWSAAWIVALALILRIRGKNPWKREISGAAIASAAALSSYIITNPFVLSDLPVFLRGMHAVSANANPRLMHLPLFAAVGLPAGLAWPSFACVLAGLVQRRNFASPARTLAAGSFLGLILMSWLYANPEKLDSLRYFAGTGIGILLAAAWLNDLGPRARNLFLLPALYAGTCSLLLDYNLHLDAAGRSTHYDAGAWIEQNIPAGSELGMLRLPQPSNSPYFQWNRYRLKFIEPQILEAPDAPRGILPEILMLTSPSYDDRSNLRHLLERDYALVQSFPPASWGPISLPVGDIYGNPLIEIYKKTDKPHPPGTSNKGR